MPKFEIAHLQVCMNTFDTLPDELVLEILDACEYYMRPVLRIVCVRFHRMTSSNSPLFSVGDILRMVCDRCDALAYRICSHVTVDVQPQVWNAIATKSAIYGCPQTLAFTCDKIPDTNTALYGHLIVENGNIATLEWFLQNVRKRRDFQKIKAVFTYALHYRYDVAAVHILCELLKYYYCGELVRELSNECAHTRKILAMAKLKL